MLATGMDRDKRTRLLIDVGTNCEIVLSDGDRIVSTAAPAGPAFEGGAIRCGMRAADGAIEVVRIDPRGRHPRRARRVIGDVEARGLCGSGLVDAVSELVRGRRAGRFGAVRAGRAGGRDGCRRSPTGSTRIGQERVFVLRRPAADASRRGGWWLSQRDVREDQFAKAAISTGWRLLLEGLGPSTGDVQQVLLAGFVR